MNTRLDTTTLLASEWAEVRRSVRRLVARRGLGGSEDDILQEAALVALRAGRRFETGGRDGFRSWFYRIASNTCSRWIQSRCRRREIPQSAAELENLEDPLDPGTVESSARVDPRGSDRAADGLVMRTLDNLGEARREWIVLRDFLGLDWKLIAEITGVPHGEAARLRHRRATALHREQLRRSA